MRPRIGTLIGFFVLICISLSAQPPKQEVRAAWIATVNRIDWPNQAGLTAEEQKQELISILDFLENRNFNTVIFQVRPTSDALYRSKTEPWSAWLSGTQGTAPDKNWDPLDFIIDECHQRGMELHAWFNPFRITQNSKNVLAPNNIAKIHPEWTLSYDNKIVLDPGIPAVGEYIIEVVKEVVSMYDVDAIHFDDYFYPYPTTDKKMFPDTASFRQYGKEYTIENKNDWRRENVDHIIEEMGKQIKTVKPYVKFGVSPFGVWRNNGIDSTGSATSSNITNYDDLYADAIKWQKMGWIDYLMPQIYWEPGHPNADYNTLTDWWAKHYYGRHIYIGLAAYKASEAVIDAWKNPNLLTNQIEISRNGQKIEGIGLFRSRHIIENKSGWMDSISNKLFQYKALIPAMPWIDSIAPLPPDRIMLRNDLISWAYRKEKPSSDIKQYIIYASTKRNEKETENPANIVAITKSTSFHLDNIGAKPGEIIYIWISAIDRLNNESKPTEPLKYKMRTP